MPTEVEAMDNVGHIVGPLAEKSTCVEAVVTAAVPTQAFACVEVASAVVVAVADRHVDSHQAIVAAALPGDTALPQTDAAATDLCATESAAFAADVRGGGDSGDSLSIVETLEYSEAAFQVLFQAVAEEAGFGFMKLEYMSDESRKVVFEQLKTHAAKKVRLLQSGADAKKHADAKLFLVVYTFRYGLMVFD